MGRKKVVRNEGERKVTDKETKSDRYTNVLCTQEEPKHIPKSHSQHYGRKHVTYKYKDCVTHRSSMNMTAY